jgi:hypothetical protein
LWESAVVAVNARYKRAPPKKNWLGIAFEPARSISGFYVNLVPIVVTVTIVAVIAMAAVVV